jgi:hypothetical protein
VGEHPHRGIETVTIVTRVKLPTGTRPARAASLVREMCNG